MKPPPVWPPLLVPVRLPWLYRLRDIVLTLSAWAIFFYLLEQATGHFAKFFSRPDWTDLWIKVRVFAIASAILVGWISIWAVIRYGFGRRPVRSRPPSALQPPVSDAALLNLTPDQIAAAQSWREIQVEFTEDGRVSRLAPPAEKS